MRFLIRLHPETLDPAVPVNYQYHLASALYGILRDVEPVYARFLHEEGYVSDRGKHLKLFCFSRLQSNRRPMIQDDVLRWYGRPSLHFYVSSPLHETFMHNTLTGLLSGARIVLGSGRATAAFGVSEVSEMPAPDFTKGVHGIPLGPMTTAVQEPGRNTPTYLSPFDARFADAIRCNLLGKYAVLTGTRNDDLPFIFHADEEYLNGKDERAISKLITIKQGRPDQTRVRGFVFPFRLHGHPDLLHIAWDCGLGEKNSLGFGMWDVRTIPANTSVIADSYSEHDKS